MLETVVLFPETMEWSPYLYWNKAASGVPRFSVQLACRYDPHRGGEMSDDFVGFYKRVFESQGKVAFCDGKFKGQKVSIALTTEAEWKRKDAEIARLTGELEYLKSGKALQDIIFERDSLLIDLAAAGAEVERLNAWVNDLQSGMYINCVYCGHRYGPQDKVPCSMAEALKKHIEQCPKHPMSALKQDLAACRKVIEGVRKWMLESQFCSAPYCRKCVVKLYAILGPEGKKNSSKKEESC